MTRTHHVRNPWSGALDFRFTQLEAEDAAHACDELNTTQKAWAGRTLEERLGVLAEFSDALHAEREEIVAALIEDTGRERIARLEFDLLVQTIRRVIDDAPAALGDPDRRKTRVESIEASSQRVPYGLMLNIAPWNFPLLLSFLDVLPALAAGNAVVIKPSEVTPRWTEPVQRAITAVPEIAAVLAILPGDGAFAARLMEHADIVSFTGSVATGRIVNETAARLFVPAYLELGGKDPAIVLADADVSYAARTILFSAMSASGQACQSLEAALVHASIFDDFVRDIVTAAEQMTINYPDRTAGFVGPFIMEAQAHKVAAQIADAIESGATVHCGGELIEHGGLWMLPTIITDVTTDMRIMREETFGPVLPVLSFDDEEDAISMANASGYGLSASVFGSDPDKARAVARRLNAGAININDASLTSRVHDTEHESFGISGLGPGRFGNEGFTRYTRRKAILENFSGTSAVAG
jgi:acyl-CoA reductase-like NAD-dependent aldehyde dehydrogenase